MDRSKIGLVIPAYNESATIYDVVKAASEYGQPIVVNDCSNDDNALASIDSPHLKRSAWCYKAHHYLPHAHYQSVFG